jgi:hypothetical protein
MCHPYLFLYKSLANPTIKLEAYLDYNISQPPLIFLGLTSPYLEFCYSLQNADNQGFPPIYTFDLITFKAALNSILFNVLYFEGILLVFVYAKPQHLFHLIGRNNVEAN